MDIDSFIAPHVRQMKAYTPIVPFEVLSQRLGIPVEQIVKLDANENLYGPSPRAIQAIATAHQLHIYPDPDQAELRSAISDYIGVPKAHILCGAGADEIIQLIGMAFLQHGDVMLDLPPTFGMYRWLADITGAHYVAVPRRADFSIDVEAVESRVTSHESNVKQPALSLPKGQTSISNLQSPIANLQSPIPNSPKLIFVTNPNNPDGSTVDDATLKSILALPLIVVLDEAYIDFSDQPSRASWVQAYPNLIILRTFSKLLGMAGMRIGYGIFPLGMIEHLWKLKQPYTPTVASSIGAVAALGDRVYLQDNVQRIVAERARMGALLSDLGWLHVYPSQTNFLLCRVSVTMETSDQSPGQMVKSYLEQHGILVRYFDKDGLRDCFRVSVGRPEHTDRLVQALKRFNLGN